MKVIRKQKRKSVSTKINIFDEISSTIKDNRSTPVTTRRNRTLSIQKRAGKDMMRRQSKGGSRKKIMYGSNYGQRIP